VFLSQPEGQGPCTLILMIGPVRGAPRPVFFGADLTCLSYADPRLDGTGLHSAWEGPLTPGARHYYRVQGGDLLIEYDTTDDGNHVHTVLRRPHSDFGGDVLAAHYARERR